MDMVCGVFGDDDDATIRKNPAWLPLCEIDVVTTTRDLAASLIIFNIQYFYIITDE